MRNYAVLLAVLGLCSLAANAAVIDTFDDGDAAGWADNSPASNAEWAVVDGAYVQTNAGLSTTDGGNQLGAISVWDGETFGSFTYTVDVMLYDTGSSYDDAALVWGYNSNEDYYLFILLDGDGDKVYQRDSGSRAELSGTLTSVIDKAGQWYTVQVTYDSGTGALEIQAKTGSDAFATAWSGMIATGISGKIGVGAVNDKASFDNVHVVPEPASMVLPGLGGLAAVIRRR